MPTGIQNAGLQFDAKFNPFRANLLIKNTCKFTELLHHFSA